MVVFVTVPVLLYQQFSAADMDKRRMILDRLEVQGQVIGEALSPRLTTFDSESLRGVSDTLQRLGNVDGMNIKLLLRPIEQEGEPGGFFYIASTPQVSNEYLQEERNELVEMGLFDKLRDSCIGNQPLAVRYVNPGGDEEVLTSVTPVQTNAGCWAVITSHDTDEALGAVLGQPYWQTPQVRLALGIYIGMAAVVVLLFLGIWGSLNRFARLARDIRVKGLGQSAPSFSAMNRVPELSGVALEFDRMVATLHNSASAIRHAAEDNAHAFKTPIATIAQSIEPVKRSLSAEQPRAKRAVHLIERSLSRLDALVGAARQMEFATAELMEAPRTPVDLSNFVHRTLDGYAEPMKVKKLYIRRQIEHRRTVLAADDMLETVLENLLDNAADFSPEGGVIDVAVRRDGRLIELSVADEGPGVPPDRLHQIFERYVSSRSGNQSDESSEAGNQHFGIGLWLVRRNVEALGGSVHAEANDPQGLRVVVRFPRG